MADCAETRLFFSRLFSASKLVITGFNTDIEFQGITYHVQTEDKGLASPMILSLVYDGGTILASKRSPYDDLLGNFDENVLAERLQKQHKLICAAIRAGRIEELKRMTLKESAAKRDKLAAQKELARAAEIKQNESLKQAPAENGNTKVGIFPPPVQKEISIPAAEKATPVLPPFNLNQTPVEKPFEIPVQKREFEAPLTVPFEIVEEVQIIEDVQIIEEEAILPADAVAIISDSVQNNPANDKLSVKFLSEEVFRSGEKKTVSILVYRGAAENYLGGAHIMVKILGSTFRPLIFHAKTDGDGVATIHLQMPRFQGGRATILIKAMSNGEEVELRRAITQS